MAFSEEQLKGLNIAAQRRQIGGADFTATDKKNLEWAESQGWKWTPTAPAGKTAIPGAEYDTREKQMAAFSDIEPVGNTLYGVPIPKQITPDDLSTPKVPTIQPQAIDTQPYVAGLDTGIKGFESIIQQTLTPPPAEAEISPIRERMGELTDEFKQKPIDYQAELDRYGFQTNVKDLQGMNLQLASVKAEYDRLAEEVRNKPISSRIIGGTTDMLLRQKAVELGGLSEMAQALQGNANLAMSIADKTIQIKYEPLERQIENQKWQLDQVYSQLNREEKRKADALNFTLNERQRLIADEKEKEINISNIMLTAAQNGADSATLQAIKGSENYQEAIMAAKDVLNVSIDGITPSKIGQDKNGRDLFWDPVTKTVKTGAQLTKDELGDRGIISPSGNAYDMSTYATDPKHPQSVQNIIDRIGKFNSVEDIDAYIQSVKPNSPITGQMIAEASAQYGIGWEELVALIQHESGLGTSNVAKNNNNLGGITWNANFPESMKGTARPSVEGGNYVKFNTMQEGINSIAYELSKRKVDITGDTETISDYNVGLNYVNDPENADKSPEQLKSDLMAGKNSGQLDLTDGEINAIVATVKDNKAPSEEKVKVSDNIPKLEKGLSTKKQIEDYITSQGFSPDEFIYYGAEDIIEEYKLTNPNLSDKEVAELIIEEYGESKVDAFLKEMGLKSFWRGTTGELTNYIKSL